MGIISKFLSLLYGLSNPDEDLEVDAQDALHTVSLISTYASKRLLTTQSDPRTPWEFNIHLRGHCDQPIQRA